MVSPTNHGGVANQFTLQCGRIVVKATAHKIKPGEKSIARHQYIVVIG